MLVVVSVWATGKSVVRPTAVEEKKFIDVKFGIKMCQLLVSLMSDDSLPVFRRNSLSRRRVVYY